MHIYLRHCSFLVFTLLSLTCSAQDSAYIPYKKLITQADGLPDRNVTCGIQDKYGFLWFGMRSGLCRYDGSSFIFQTQKNHGLRGTSILSLVADDNLGIIITYTNMGSSIFSNGVKDVVNIQTLKVTPLSSYYPSIPFHEEDINRIVYTKGKPLRFFINDQDYFWSYSSAHGFEKKWLKGKPLQAKIPGLEKRSVQKIKAINDALTREVILEDDSTLTTYRNEYLTLVCDKRGYILHYQDVIGEQSATPYFLTFKGELLPLDSAGKIQSEIRNYDVSFWSTNYRYDLHSLHPRGNRESAIMQLTDGNVVFFVPSQGYIKLFGKEESIHVNSFFKDQQGDFWLCTNVGLYKVTFKKNIFKRHFTRDDKKFAFNNSVRGIYADNELMLANLYDSPVLQINEDTLFLGTQQNFSVIREDCVLWLGEWRLRKFDLHTRKVQLCIESQKSEIWSIYKLSNTQLLLGCTEGLDMYDITSQTITSVSCQPFPEATFIYKIFQNSKGELMAVAENGLYILSSKGVVLDFFSNVAKPKNRQLPCATIYDVYEDKQGMYWIASNLEGLFQWNKTNHTFRQFGIPEGFLSTVIYRIQEDDYDNLWISTDFGLVSLNRKNFGLKTYTELDGITSNEFNRSSSFKDKNGRMYFGGMNGVTSFHPKDFQKSGQQTYPLSVLNFYLFDTKTDSLRDKTANLISTKQIVMHEENTMFTLSYALLDYENRTHPYAYKLEGLDNDWNYSSENKARISNPPYGSYILRVRARLANGDWNKQEIIIPVIVIIPFYKTWWFISIVAILFAALIYFIVKIRTHNLKRQNIKLELMISERTEELRTALNEQTALIQEIHHRVKNNLQFIQAMIDMQIAASKNESNQLALLDTARRINAMTLVHEMLYNKDKLETISLTGYIQELVDKLSEIVNDNQIPIRFNVRIDDIHFNINNCLAIGMITSELLSNSIKHAFKEIKQPVIDISLTRKADGKTIIFIVKDNGRGFDRNTVASGLGMRLIDIFTRQLRGTYSLQNQSGLLFTFEFNLP